MPLLPKEVEIFPADLFSLPDERSWRVAHVRSRQEKSLARYLLERRVPFYLPQIERATERAGRRFVSYLPLFPGYVFFRGEREAREAALRSDVVARILDVDDQRRLTRELAQIRLLQEAGASLIPLDEVVPGDPVEVREGAFKGYLGVVMRHGRGTRLVVSVSLLRSNVAVEFDSAMIRRRRPTPARA